jgi:hypothetical protein
MMVIIIADEFCDERSVYLLDIDGEYNLFGNPLLFRVGLQPDQAGSRPPLNLERKSTCP